MTDRPYPGGADTAVGPTPGYYPDPSVPGFVRYWGGAAWVPGTSRPAPAEGEVLEPPRFAARHRPQAAARYMPPPVVPVEPVAVVAEPGVGETGPLYFDQTTGGASFSIAPYAELELRAREAEQPAAVADGGEGAAAEPAGWQADPQAQRGLLETGGAPRWVSWGVLPGQEGEALPESGAEPEQGPESEAEREPGLELEVGPEPEPAPEPELAPLPVTVPELAAPVPAPAAPVREVAKAPAVVERPAPVVRVPAPAKAPAAPRPRPAARRRPAPRPPAGLGRRLTARLVDTAVLLVVAAAAGVPLGNSVADHVEQKLAQARMASTATHQEVQVLLVDGVVLGKVAVLLGILAFVGVLYEVLPTARTGQTFGKRLVGIRVVDARTPSAAGAVRGPLGFGRSLLRWLVRQLSVLLLVGWCLPLFDRPARRGWQDRAAGTRVVRG